MMKGNRGWENRQLRHIRFAHGRVLAAPCRGLRLEVGAKRRCLPLFFRRGRAQMCSSWHGRGVESAVIPGDGWK